MKSKFVILALVLALFVLPLVSAGDWADWDNHKVFKDCEVPGQGNAYGVQNKCYGTVEIYDEPFLGLGDDTLLREVTLETNTETCFNTCEATGSMKLYTDGKLADDLRFENLDPAYNTEIKSSQFYIKSGEESIMKDVYEEVCTPLKQISMGNSTQNCEIVHSQREIIKDVWSPYSGENLEAGEYEWKLVGEKGMDQGVDWIATFDGIEATEWAVWGPGFEQDLYAYYSFEDNVSTTVIDSLGIRNGTAEGGFSYNESGKIGRAGSFDGIDGAVEMFSENQDFTDINWSVAMWAKVTSFNFAPNRAVLYSRHLSSVNGNLWVGIGYGDTSKDAFFPWWLHGDGGVQFSTEPIVEEEWIFVAFTRDGVTGNYTAYVNGTAVDSSLATLNKGQGGAIPHYLGLDPGFAPDRYHDGLIDEVGVWNRVLTPQEVNDLWNEGRGMTFQGGDVTLVSPSDNFISPLSEITFVCEVGLGDNIANVTLYTDDGGFGPSNITTGYGSPTTTANITYNFTGDGSYIWTCQACDINANCEFAGQNRTISISVGAPSMNVFEPTGEIPYAIDGEEVYVNWTTSVATDTCILIYNGVNTTVPCQDNSSTINLVEGVTDLEIFVNDTAGSEFINGTNWNYTVFATSQKFSPMTNEGATENFELNVTTRGPITGVAFFYNNTENAASINTLGGNDYSLTASVEVPPVGGVATVPFFWRIRINPEVNTTEENQTVNDISIDDCSSGKNLLVNYTLYDEDDLSFLTPGPQNTSIEVDLTISNPGTQTEIVTFNRTYTFDNSAEVCLITNITGTFRLDSIAKYSSLDRVVEFHNIQNFELTNTTIPINVSLYDLLSSRSQEFLVTYKDSNFIPVEGALIELTRRYIGEGIFRSVEAPVTDEDGQALLHLVLGDEIYTIIVSKDGVILATFDNIVPFCSDLTTGNCRINLNEPSSFLQSEDFTTSNGLTFTLSFDRSTKVVESVFSTLSGATAGVSLNVTLADSRGNTTVCNDFLETSSGTLSCTVPTVYENSTLIASVYKDGTLAATKYGEIGVDPALIWGGSRVIMILILILTLPLLALTSGIATILLVLLALIIASLLSLYTGTIGVGTTILWIILAGGVLIWKISRRS